MKALRSSILFLLVGSFSILLGLGLSFKWMGSARSQSSPTVVTAPTSDLPAELLELPEAGSPPPGPQPSSPGAQGSGPKGIEALPGDREDALVELPMDAVDQDSSLDSYIQPKAASDGYVYDPTGRRDPFRPFKLGTRIGIGSANIKIEMSSEIPLEPLQKFELASLEIIGIVWDTGKPKALIRDPSRIVHTVLKGQKIGKNDGFVAEIREGEIIVVEAYEDQGRVVKDARILSIKK